MGAEVQGKRSGNAAEKITRRRTLSKALKNHLKLCCKDWSFLLMFHSSPSISSPFLSSPLLSLTPSLFPPALVLFASFRLVCSSFDLVLSTLSQRASSFPFVCFRVVSLGNTLGRCPRNQSVNIRECITSTIIINRTKPSHKPSV